MSRVRPTSLVVAIVAILSVTLTGCGGSKSDVSDLSAKAQLAKAKSSVKSAKSVTISGKSDDQGSSVNLDVSYAGSDSQGKIDLGGSTIEVLAVGGKSWFKANDGFWKSQAAAQADTIIKATSGKWIVVPAGNKDFADLTSIGTKKFVTDDILDPDGTVKKGKAKKVNGVDCVALVSDNGTLYLDKSNGQPIRIASKAKADGGNLDFDYDKVDAPKAPADEDAVDLSALGQ